MSESEEQDKGFKKGKKTSLELIFEIEQSRSKRSELLVKRTKPELVECVLRQQELVDRLSNEVKLLSETNSRLTVELLLKQRLEVDFRKFFLQFNDLFALLHFLFLFSEYGAYQFFETSFFDLIFSSKTFLLFYTNFTCSFFRNSIFVSCC